MWLDKLHSGKSYHAIGCEVSATVFGSLNRHIHRSRLCINWLIRMSSEPNPAFPLGSVLRYLLIQYSW